jgi:hypothetical protein
MLVQNVMNHRWLVIGLVLMSLLNLCSQVKAAPNALPKAMHLQYDVTKNGQPFATVKEQYEVSGNTYKIESITKGIGVYALFGERKLTSTGEVTSDGLKPMHFELHQGDNPKRALITTFDWVNNKLQMLVKGREKTAELTAGTQDLASYAYQWMFNADAIKHQVAVSLTTGKKLNHYVYDVAPASFEIAGKQSQTLHLTPIKEANAQESVETKELWLAAEYHYLPVRILIVDENGQKLEQTLTEFNAK